MSTSPAKFAQIATAIGLVCASTPALADGDPAAWAAKGYTCIGCHGVTSYHNVYPSYHVPKLVGQHPEYILAALKAYGSGEREHPTMNAQAGAMTEQDMKDIAAWIASLASE